MDKVQKLNNPKIIIGFRESTRAHHGPQVVKHTASATDFSVQALRLYWVKLMTGHAELSFQYRTKNERCHQLVTF
jgi:hypothetical protein